MISIDPTARPTFDSLLHSARGIVFPETFYSFLHNYVATVNEISTSSPFHLSPQSHITSAVASPISPQPSLSKGTINLASGGPTANGTSSDVFTEPLPSDSDHRMDKIWSDYESVEPYLMSTPSESEDLEKTIREPVTIEYAHPSAGIMGQPLQVSAILSHAPTTSEPSIFRTSFLLNSIFLIVKVAYSKAFPTASVLLMKVLYSHSSNKSVVNASSFLDGPALILLALITANLRTCSLPSSKRKALDVFLALAPHLTDEAKLDRMVPYIIELLSDDSPSVRAGAVRTLMQIVSPPP